MPYPNEHSCRMKDPGGFADDSFRRISRDNEEFPDGSGKIYPISLIIGKLKGKSAPSDPTTLQAFRYPKDKWNASTARRHCTHNKGISFEAATKESKEVGMEQDKIIREAEEMASIGHGIEDRMFATTNFAGSPRSKYGTHSSKGFKGSYEAAWRCHFSKIGGGALTGAAGGPIRGTVRRTEMIAAGMKPPCNLPGTENIGARGGGKSPLDCSFPSKPSDYGLSGWASPKDDNLTAEDIRLTCQDLAVIKRAALGEVKWRAQQREKNVKEATMAEKLSYENKRTMLDAALHTHLGLAKDDYAYVEDFTETEIFYNRDRQSYKAPYSIAEDEGITIGDSVKVTRRTTYKTMEALQVKYSEIIQEAGKRDISADEKRCNKVVAVCSGVLKLEGVDETRISEATSEADELLSWLKEQKVVKTDDGTKYPAEAYAYMLDEERPSTWELRLWEDPQKKVTRAQLGRVAAAFSPGGFRGQKVQIPSADVATVKRKIRAAYRKLGVEEEDIPRWVKEAETREELRNYVPLTEAKFDKGRATVIIIKPGFNFTEDRYYPEEMLKRDYGIFEGLKMYADHPTESEEKERPERSIKDWVATLTGVACDESGVVTGVAEIVEPWLMQKLAALREKGMLSEMGISIDAVGHASKDTIDGKETLVIEKLVACRSVDFVTEPGAGGVVTFYEADRSRDVDLVELSALKVRRPDLIKVIEAEVRAKITTEVKKAMEDKDKIVELEGQIATLTEERDKLQTKVTEGEKDKLKAEAQATVKEAVDKAELPEATKERLIERFKDAESADGIEEAIQFEKDYIAKLTEAGEVRGLGKSQPESEKDQVALTESLKRAHPDWSKEQIETAVAGR